MTGMPRAKMASQKVVTASLTVSFSFVGVSTCPNLNPCMIQKAIHRMIPGITPAMNSEPTDTDAVVANTTMGILGGMMIPSEAEDAVTAAASVPL